MASCRLDATHLLNLGDQTVWFHHWRGNFPRRRNTNVFDSFHSQQQQQQYQSNQQQHGGWQQQQANQQHGWQQQPPNQQQRWQQQPPNQQQGWHQQPPNQQQGWQQQPPNQQQGWQQQPPNQQQGWQQQPPNQQHGGQQQPPNQQQGWQQQPPNQHHGGQQQPPNQQQHGSHQPPSSNEQSVTDSQQHGQSKQPNEQQTDKDQGEGADDEVEAVNPPKAESESKKKLAEEKDAEAKMKQRAEEVKNKKEAAAKDEERDKEKIEEKAKEMLKALPPIPEDDQAEHRSWESSLSTKDIKQTMELSRDMDALRNKQHEGAFVVKERTPSRPSGFLHFEAATAPPQHISSESARASGLQEEINANHRSWEAKLSAEELKQQMTQSRERDSMRGTTTNGTAEDSAGAESSGSKTSSSRTGGGTAEEDGKNAGKKGGKKGGKNAEDDEANGEANGEGSEAAGEDGDAVKVEVEADPDQGAATPVVLLPLIRQLGESIGLNDHWKNYVTSINLAMKNSRVPKFFCGRQGARVRELPEDDHPTLQFRYPVKNINVELTDLGRDGKGSKVVIWSATYSTDKAISNLPGTMRPDGGDQTTYKPPCYVAKTKNRLELRVIADDPITGTAEEIRAEEIHKKRTDRSVDEVSDLEVQLIDRDDPIMLERYRREAPAANYFGSGDGAGGGPGTSGSHNGHNGSGDSEELDDFAYVGSAPPGAPPPGVDSGVFGSAEEAEAYAQMMADLVKYPRRGPYVASAERALLCALPLFRIHTWKSGRQSFLSHFL